MTDDQQTIENREGTVDYWSDSDQYVINFTEPGTIDSMITAFVDDLPESLKEPGLKVVVSGTLTQSEDLPAPRMGGQVIYALRISEIKRVAGQ